MLNKVFVLNGTARTLVGIMPPRFGWYDADVWIPKTPHPGMSIGFAGLPERWFILGRPKPGVSMAQASEDLTGILTQWPNSARRIIPPSSRCSLVQFGHSGAEHFESPLYIVLVAVGLLLLIGCVNVANLMLARATSREKEFALRAVLGAGRSRLVRLLLAESLVLAIGGAALGVLIAWGGLKLIVATMPPDSIPAESVIGLNPQVMAFTLVLAVVTPLIFGLAPALQAARRDLNDPLRERGRGVIGGFRTARIARRGGGDRSGRVTHAAGGRWPRDAQFCGPARRELGTAGGSRLQDDVAVAAGPLQDGGASEHIFPTPAGPCKGDPRRSGCGGIELDAAQ